jgi:SWI/SNF-related matrix-associated actin-dependent regulator of chromatin subfamily D
MLANRDRAERLAEDARRKRAEMLSRKPTDRDMPAGVDEIALGGAVERYQKLRELERKLDATMMRKRLDIQDQPRDVKRRRTMRVWISNTAENQPWQATGLDPESFDFGDNSQASYRVKIEGRLLDDEDVLDATTDGKDADAMDTDGEKADKKAAQGEMTKLAHFFKKITIDFDRPPSLQPDNMAQIEWDKKQSTTANGSDFDCLHFERKSDENINIRINLYPDNQPEIYKLSDELSQICGGIKEDTKANITMNVWKYIRVNKLDGGEDARKARCDALMKQVHFPIPHTMACRQRTNEKTGLRLRCHRAQPRWRRHHPALPPAPAHNAGLHHPRRQRLHQRDPQTLTLHHLRRDRPAK